MYLGESTSSQTRTDGLRDAYHLSSHVPPFDWTASFSRRLVSVERFLRA